MKETNECSKVSAKKPIMKTFQSSNNEICSFMVAFQWLETFQNWFFWFSHFYFFDFISFFEYLIFVLFLKRFSKSFWNNSKEILSSETLVSLNLFRMLPLQGDSEKHRKQRYIENIEYQACHTLTEPTTS